MKIDGAIEINFAGEILTLLPDRAIWWGARSTLIVADVHLGKSASFRLLGVPVPTGATTKDLSRLSSLVHHTGARRLVFLGDLVHSRRGRQNELLDAVETWRATHGALDILLVRGNHDRASGVVPEQWRMEEVDEPFIEGPIALAHDPKEMADRPMLAGHVHPVVSLSDYDRSNVSIPCFVFDSERAILPAFGSFTGGFRIEPTPTRSLYLVAGRRVIRYDPLLRKR